MQTENLKYDERKKILHRTVLDKDKIVLANKEVGNYDIKNTQEYTEEGVHVLIGELKQQKQQIEQQLGIVNRTLDSTNHLEEDEEIIKMRAILKKMQTLEKRLQAKEQRDTLLDNLKVVTEQLKDVYDAVQGHIDLK